MLIVLSASQRNSYAAPIEIITSKGFYASAKILTEGQTNSEPPVTTTDHSVKTNSAMKTNSSVSVHASSVDPLTLLEVIASSHQFIAIKNIAQPTNTLMPVLETSLQLETTVPNMETSPMIKDQFFTTEVVTPTVVLSKLPDTDRVEHSNTNTEMRDVTNIFIQTVLASGSSKKDISQAATMAIPVASSSEHFLYYQSAVVVDEMENSATNSLPVMTSELSNKLETNVSVVSTEARKVAGELISSTTSNLKMSTGVLRQIRQAVVTEYSTETSQVKITTPTKIKSRGISNTRKGRVTTKAPHNRSMPPVAVSRPTLLNLLTNASSTYHADSHFLKVNDTKTSEAVFTLTTVHSNESIFRTSVLMSTSQPIQTVDHSNNVSSVITLSATDANSLTASSNFSKTSAESPPAMFMESHSTRASPLVTTKSDSLFNGSTNPISKISIESTPAMLTVSPSNNTFMTSQTVAVAATGVTTEPFSTTSFDIPVINDTSDISQITVTNEMFNNSTTPSSDGSLQTSETLTRQAHNTKSEDNPSATSTVSWTTEAADSVSNSSSTMMTLHVKQIFNESTFETIVVLFTFNNSELCLNHSFTVSLVCSTHCRNGLEQDIKIDGAFGTKSIRFDDLQHANAYWLSSKTSCPYYEVAANVTFYTGEINLCVYCLM